MSFVHLYVYTLFRVIIAFLLIYLLLKMSHNRLYFYATIPLKIARLEKFS